MPCHVSKHIVIVRASVRMDLVIVHATGGITLIERRLEARQSCRVFLPGAAKLNRTWADRTRKRESPGWHRGSLFEARDGDPHYSYVLRGS